MIDSSIQAQLEQQKQAITQQVSGQLQLLNHAFTHQLQSSLGPIQSVLQPCLLLFKSYF